MASGILANGVDLDSLFKARTGAARAAVGFQVAGVDIAQRYEQRSTTAIAATGFQANGTDLAQLFEGLGSAAISLGASRTIQSTSGEPRNAAIELQSAGTMRKYLAGAYGSDGNWCTPTTSAPGAYRARATQQSYTNGGGGGSITGDVTATWKPLTAAIAWTLSQATTGTSTWVLLVEIDNGAGLVLSQCTFTLKATR